MTLLLHSETLGSYYAVEGDQATLNDLWGGCATKPELLSDVLETQDSRERVPRYFLSKVSSIISRLEMFMLLFYF